MKFCRMVLAVFMLLLGLAGISDLAAEVAPGQGVVIDTRTDAEWAAGHLEGAVLIPYDKIAEVIGTTVPEKKTKISLYCRTGRRSGIALETLKKLGYGDVTNLGSLESAAKSLKREIVR